MSSVVAGIITFLETNIEAALPTIQKSRHYYDLEKNPGSKNDYIYAIRAGSASPVTGAVKNVTMRQDFEVEIARDFAGSDLGDVSLRTAISAIYQDNEAIAARVTLSKTASVLVVEAPSYDAPVIHQNGRSVSITFTYPIIYRKGIQ